MDSTPAAGFLRGDCNGDGEFAGSVVDAVAVLDYALRGGAPPAAPFPDCELLDAIEGELGCETPHNCQ
jgi:hypothetical protein